MNVDFFYENRNTYLVMVDYFSSLFELEKLKRTTTRDITRALSVMFPVSEHTPLLNCGCLIIIRLTPNSKVWQRSRDLTTSQVSHIIYRGMVVVDYFSGLFKLGKLKRTISRNITRRLSEMLLVSEHTPSINCGCFIIRSIWILLTPNSKG